MAYAGGARARSFVPANAPHPHGVIAVNHIASALVRERVAELHREARSNRAINDVKTAAKPRLRRPE
jgi:hypothetical protein